MNAFSNDYLAIILMGISVYIIRVAGFWLAGKIQFNHFTRIWLSYLPGTIMMSIIAPNILTANWVEYIAAAVVIYMMYRFNNLLLALICGVGINFLYHVL
jgi:branched-subunit amino acid transport protein